MQMHAECELGRSISSLPESSATFIALPLLCSPLLSVISSLQSEVVAFLLLIALYTLFLPCACHVTKDDDFASTFVHSSGAIFQKKILQCYYQIKKKILSHKFFSRKVPLRQVKRRAIGYKTSPFGNIKVHWHCHLSTPHYKPCIHIFVSSISSDTLRN